MKVKATSQIIDWDAEKGCALILNIGDEGDLSEAMLAKHEGSYTKVSTKPQLDHDGDGKSGGSKAGDESTATLGEARKRYREVFGKNAGPKWDVAKIEEMIAAKASAPTGVDDSEDDDAAAPPVD